MFRPYRENPTTDQLVEYAMLSNAELEQHYWEWRSAIEQIPQDGTQIHDAQLWQLAPAITHGAPVGEAARVSLSNDPMTDIKWPSKLDAAASNRWKTPSSAAGNSSRRNTSCGTKCSARTTTTP